MLLRLPATYQRTGKSVLRSDGTLFQNNLDVVKMTVEVALRARLGHNSRGTRMRRKTEDLPYAHFCDCRFASIFITKRYLYITSIVSVTSISQWTYSVGNALRPYS